MAVRAGAPRHAGRVGRTVAGQRAGDTELLISPDGSRNRVGLNDTILVEWGEAEMVLDDDGAWRITNYVDDVGGAAQVPFDEIDEQLKEGLLCGGRTLK